MQHHPQSATQPCTLLFRLSVAVLIPFALTGCGNNVPNILFQSVTATGNTTLDLLLTQFANQVVDAFDQQGNDPNDGDGNGADGDNDGGANDGDGDADGDGDGGGVLPAGDAARGEDTFQTVGCAVCHGEMAEGVIGPALFGMDKSAEIAERFGGGASHNGLMLSDQEQADILAWLMDESPG